LAAQRGGSRSARTTSPITPAASSDASAYLAGHTDALLRGRDRHESGRHCADQVRDPFEKNVPGIGVGRDRCRTPMQRDATTHAGFSMASAWLPLADDYVHENAAIWKPMQLRF
jgi:hypothetical protein